MTYRSRSIRSRTFAALLACVLLPLVTAACAPNDAQVAASLSAGDTLPSMPPKSETSDIGREVWRRPLGLDTTAGSAVQHVGNTFMLAVHGSGVSMHVMVGDAPTGNISGSYALTDGAGWPSVAGPADNPTVAAPAPAPGGTAKANSVTGWSGTGAVRWTRTAADLGMAADTNLKVDPAEGDRVVVRSASGDMGPYQDANLWLLDAPTGTTVWASEVPVRWAQAAKGLLVYTWRSDGSTVEPSDRLSIRNLADGQPIATINVLNDYGAHSSMSTQCGGILSADRIVVCRWQGEDRTVMLIDRTGTSVAQWPATDAPVIDQQAEMLALFGTDPDDTVTGVDASGQVRWTVGREQFKGLSIRIDVAHDGVMVGAIQSANLAIASRTGKLLVAEDFDQLRPGGVIGNYVVEMRDGAAVGFTASGVGVGVLPDGHNSVLFVKP